MTDMHPTPDRRTRRLAHDQIGAALAKLDDPDIDPAVYRYFRLLFTISFARNLAHRQAT